MTGGAPEYVLSRWVFLRGLGIVYLAAFLSLWVHAQDLIGGRSVLPVGEYLDAVRGLTGREHYYLVPTLCWLDPGDGFLHGHCAAGAVLACLLILGVAPALDFCLLWLLYPSLTVVGQEFLGFQWDGLLLGTGFLAVLFAAWSQTGP